MTGPHSRALLLDVVRSEWGKLLATTSTYCLLASALAIEVVAGAVVSTVYAGQYNPAFAARHTVDPTFWSLLGVVFAQLPIGILAAISMTGEYSTGLASTTFIAVPQRRTVLVAKILCVATLSLLVGLLAGGVAFGLGQHQVSSEGISVGLSDPRALRAVVGSGVDLALVAILAVSLGAVVRGTAAAVSGVFVLLAVVPSLGAFLPEAWQASVVPYLPGNAGTQVLHVVPMANTVDPVAGITVFAGYATAILLAALVTIAGRDVPSR